MAAFTDSQFEDAIKNETDALFAREFSAYNNLSQSLFHYTKPEPAGKIVSTQTFHASFIRSTSDPLEFVLPMVHCRDWLTNPGKNQIFGGTQRLFRHFNEQAENPDLRGYFISFSTKQNSEYLVENYGEAIIQVDPVEPVDMNKFGFFVPCKYVPNTEVEIDRLLDLWQTDVYLKTATKYQFVPSKPSVCFYLLMYFCYCISVSTKQDSYHKEEEVRFIAAPRRNDDGLGWFKQRRFKLIKDELRVLKEYIEVDLKQQGLSARLLKLPV